MRVAALCISMLMIGAGQSSACDDRFTAEIFDPGAWLVEITKDVAGSRTFRVGVKDALKSYSLECSGSPYTCYLVPDEGVKAAPIEYLEHKGDLILDMMVFVPYCRIQ